MSKGKMMWRGLRRRCPRCGGRGWFRGLFERGERCVVCGYKPDRQVGFVLGAIAINMVVTLSLLGAVLAVGIAMGWPDPEPVPIMVAGMAVAVIVPVLGYSVSHTLWAAIDLSMRPLDPAEEADAAAWLAANPRS
jgi:uncharacterized protein (DUF983 family)